MKPWDSLLDGLRPARPRLRVYTDGAIRPAQGASGLAAVAFDEQGRLLRWWVRCVGALSNNAAEYAAVLLALEELRPYRPSELAVFTDSRVVVEQAQGLARVRSPHLLALHARLRAAALEFDSLHFYHIPRQRNRLADALANDAVDGWLRADD